MSRINQTLLAIWLNPCAYASKPCPHANNQLPKPSRKDDTASYRQTIRTCKKHILNVEKTTITSIIDLVRAQKCGRLIVPIYRSAINAKESPD
ncbi:hypothetical protein ACFOY8_06140 [Thalassospira xianhensis]|uniref:hypothetical protein n=1 Tax=Thalassospira xianhensis TaxID=478503 RepID=UPI0011BF8AA2|nr:hypothetical protein [Thalassospira xianhensis]